MNASTRAFRIDRARSDLITRRAIASLLDYGLLALLVYPWVRYFGDIDDSGLAVVSGRLALPPLLFWVFLFPFTESCFSASLGKHLLRLRIVPTDKRPLTFSRHLKRRLLDPLDLFATDGLLAAVLVALTPGRQRLGDLWARARVERTYRVPPPTVGAT